MRKPGEAGESFTVGVDDNTGRVVIIRNNREVIGNLSREDSIKFSQDVIEWQPAFMRAKPSEVVNGPSS